MSEVYSVQFKDVGRNKISWSEEFHQLPTEAVIRRAVTRKKALMSRDIDVDLTDGVGCIYAGIRAVGSFSVVKEGRS